MKKFFLIPVVSVVAIMAIATLHYFSHKKSSISCSNYSKNPTGIMECIVFPNNNSQVSHALVKVISFEEKGLRPKLKLQVNTSESSSVITTAQIGFESRNDLTLVKTKDKNIYKDQHLHEYKKIPFADVPSTLNNEQELYLSIFKSDDATQDACVAHTTDLFYQYIEKPSFINYFKYYISATKCPLRISQIYY